MKLEGEHLFKGPIQDVWEMFLDPDVLGKAIPGVESFVRIDETHYEATMNIRVGPVSGKFDGSVGMEDVVAPESCTLVVEGRGAAGFVKGVGYIRFADVGDQTTQMTYTGDANIGGVLASVGQRMIDSVVKAILKPAFVMFDESLAERLAAKAG
ncbi:MAG: carbon monoxide dehydrogenase subunit G [Anaerolineae bacterium]|nr:carbon monoxide dehydrogenase subunit G [Anaerolineae bacterium]